MKDETSDLSRPEAAEKAFYRAFAECDLRAMAAVWSDAPDAVCVHPGSPPVIGREAVLQSWSSMLEGAVMPNLRVVLLNRIRHEGLAVHLVEEHIADPDGHGGSTLVLATNVYRYEQDRWRLLGHHASVPAIADHPSLQ